MRTNLGEILMEAGVITHEDWTQARDAWSAVPDPKPPVQHFLIEAGVATDVVIAQTVAESLGLQYIELIGMQIDPMLVREVPERLATRHQVVPVSRTEDELVVAMSDPTNVIAIDDIRIASRASHVTVVLAPLSAIHETLRKLYAVEKSANGILSKLADGGSVSDYDDDQGSEEDIMDADATDEEMGSIVPLTNALVADAVRAGATDVHIEPTPDAVEVRYRVDGLLREASTLPKQVQGQVVTRLKIMAGMDIAQRRRPQDGRSKVHVDGETIDTRVSTIPTISGEKVVIRILSNGGTGLDVKRLGFLPDELEILEDTLHLPQGLVVFTGPTGSGKTSTMYSGLSHIKTAEKNIITLEDPIEYRIPGLNQVQINNKAGISFAAGLRSILRQDPDVIMVGEIRDPETAETVIQSALTGHLVMSSLHTNDAPSVISRLGDLGIEPFLIASALSLVVAQRLVRSICEECKAEHTPSDRTIRLLGMSREEASQHTYMKGAGCHHCGHTGYRGRTGLYEVLQVTEELRQLIGSGANDTEIDDAVRNSGLIELRQVGLTKARMGVTTLEEVLRVTDAGKRGAPTAAPVATIPVQAAPVQVAPVQAAPVEQVAVYEAPVQPVPVQAAPVQPVAAEYEAPVPQVAQTPVTPMEFPPVVHQVAPVDFPQVAQAPAAPASMPEVDETTRAQIAEVIQASLQSQAAAESVGTVKVAEVEAPPAQDLTVHAIETREKPCVLMIDDESDMRTLARLRLQNRFAIAEAEDGEQGVSAAANLVPDLILLDHRLPDLGGIELIRKLRSDEETKDIPLIMLTGFSDPNVEMEALAAGVADFMTKPFEWDDLACRIDKAIAGQSSGVREVIVIPEDKFDEPIDLEEEQRVKAPRSELVYEEGEAVVQSMSHDGAEDTTEIDIDAEAEVLADDYDEEEREDDADDEGEMEKEGLSNNADREEYEVTPSENTHTAIPGVRIVESPIDEIRLAHRGETSRGDDEYEISESKDMEPVAEYDEIIESNPAHVPAPAQVQAPVQQPAPAPQPAPVQPAPVQPQVQQVPVQPQVQQVPVQPQVQQVPAQQAPPQPAPQQPPAQPAPVQQQAPQPPAAELFGPLFDHDWTDEEWERVLTGLIASGMLTWKRLGSFVIAQQFGR